MKNSTIQLVEKIFLIYPITFCLISLIIVAGTNVFCRFVLGFSLAWAEEFSRFIFIWASFLGVSIAFLKNEHLGVSLFIKKFNLKTRKFIFIGGNILSTVFIVLLLIKGVALVKSTISQCSPAMGISMGWVYLSFVYCCIIMFVISIYKTLKLLKIF
jgi:TRAP-type C4-dicarboxylate transport system permease small subunit